ncbi:UDP glucuronosyltransferase 2 family, polypeptide A5 isoform X7 [Astyanax mexicanus]|uniref:UDP glucuronosyltransferase 2 family, polypeptide A5 isoform X7 n=1 Tax=Astyanax mexicanus TaxID=7994 RepID=UPI0020CB22A5|nr:UDP glucuronosyltransferase 2 family, polypeptide A5 isoform X7 [Astyanax mexicanus]
MESSCVLPLVALLLLCGSGLTLGGNILVIPAEYSHWINMRVIVDELVARNHSVTVLTHSATPSIKFSKKENFKTIIYKVNVEEEEARVIWLKIFNIWMNEGTSVLQTALMFWNMWSDMERFGMATCDGMLLNKELIASLKASNFDAVLFDPVMLCSDLLAEILDLPRILSYRIMFAHTNERLCGQLPVPPSYVPAGASQGHLTDQMNFMERVENMLLYIVQTIVVQMQGILMIDNYYTKITGKPTTMCETIGKADIWLIRTYWDFEYPRPLLPNFKFVGGLHCKPAKPLPKEMEEFVQSSGDDGIVVFSLGSMINNLTKERANAIASGLGQIPQKVLWRYSGQKPDTLAPNTKLYDWIPQNDLLGHPKTKAFVTHGGTNGLYEAIYHGVPMVGIPLFGDQPDNLFHMKTKGAAEIVEFLKMTSGDLKEALTAVITNPSYKESMMRLSRIHHDRPVKALDEAVYWIEFVMRNKGAKHLRVEAHNLTWYQYHCLDVIAFLLVIVALVIFIFVKTCKWLFRKCCRRSSAKSKKE